VLIDGDHGRAGVAKDIEGVLPVLTDGAYVIFHDAHYFEVAEAIDEMVHKHADRLMDCGMLSTEQNTGGPLDRRQAGHLGRSPPASPSGRSMTETGLRASVVINTYNRAPYLRRLLPGLAHLRGGPFELVVVNGPSTDETHAVLDDYRQRIKLVSCPSRNLSHSRNLGIAAAAGDIVVFIDDDALPDDVHWLARYLDAFAADGADRVGAVGGQSGKETRPGSSSTAVDLGLWLSDVRHREGRPRRS